MRSSPILAAILLLSASGWAIGESRTYIECDRPVTCAVSYSPDLVALELHASEACEVRLWTGFEPDWATLNGERLGSGWEAADGGLVLVSVAAGSALFEFGRGRLPLRGVGRAVPVKVDGKRKASMYANFSARRFEARGSVKAPMGMYEVTVVLSTRVAKMHGAPKLRVGTATITDWDDVIAKGGRLGLRSPDNLVAGGQLGIHLTWRHDFTQMPIREIQINTVAKGETLERVEEPDLDGAGVVLIEAEDFVGEGGGGPVQVSEGEHIDQHGGASIYSFGVGQRHWVEWTCGIDAAGTYDLYARTATQEEAALRTLDVDGKPAGFVSFPGTGGWAREDPEQWAWTRVAADLDLAVGKHSIRLTTEGAKHLNVDVLALVPVD